MRHRTRIVWLAATWLWVCCGTTDHLTPPDRDSRDSVPEATGEQIWPPELTCPRECGATPAPDAADVALPRFDALLPEVANADAWQDDGPAERTDDGRLDIRGPEAPDTPTETYMPDALAEASDSGGDVEDGTDTCRPALCPDRLELMVPPLLRPNEAVTVRVRALIGTQAAVYLSDQFALRVDAGSIEPGVVDIIRGVGSVRVRLTGAGPTWLRVAGAGLQGARQVTIRDDLAIRTVGGTLTGPDLDWGPEAEVQVTSDATVPAGATLQVAAGTRVRLAGQINLSMAGRLEVSGTAEAPVWFGAMSEDTPWGGMEILGTQADLAYVMLTGGGGDSGREFGHSHSQPVVFVDSGDLTLLSTVLADNVGKALGGRYARLTMSDSLITRCDTGGEFDWSHVQMRDSHVLAIPDDDEELVNDDNDGLYLRGPYSDPDGLLYPSVIERCVFQTTKDDCIDQNGANVRIENCWLAEADNEGIACSNGGRVDIVNTWVARNGQGIEAGYGNPQVVVDHCVSIENGVGLRVGDSYDWEVSGSLTVTNTIAVRNTTHNVWNYVNALEGPLADALQIRASMVADPAWNGQNGNLAGLPSFDSTYHLLPGSNGTGRGSDGLDLGLLP